MHLIDAASDQHLWAKSFDRELRDVLALQSEAALAIAQEIRVGLTPQEGALFATVHEVDEAEGTVFIAMELVEGKTLRSLLEGKPLAIPEPRILFARLAHHHYGGPGHAPRTRSDAVPLPSRREDRRGGGWEWCGGHGMRSCGGTWR